MYVTTRFLPLAFIFVCLLDAYSAEEELVASTTPKDEPVQLVKPDFEHLKLQLIEENIDLLNNIDGSVASYRC